MVIEAHAVDVAGNPVEVNDPRAVAGEFYDTETGQRTYFTSLVAENDDAYPSAAMADADEALDPENQDAPYKGTWDIMGLDQEPVETLNGLISALGWDSLDEREQRSQLCILLGLPAWDAAPAALKEEAYAWLVATRR